MKPKKPKAKKPIYKKWWFWLIIIILAIGILGGNSDSETEVPTTPAAETSAEETSPEAESIIETEPETTNEDMKYLTETVGLEVPSAVRNDVTGNWRLSRCANTIPVEEYALLYYQNFFKSDEEIHAVVNFTLNTTTRISLMTSSTLCVDVLEYVDKEEHDAKLLFGGNLLREFFIDIETGEIEEIDLSE